MRSRLLMVILGLFLLGLSACALETGGLGRLYYLDYPYSGMVAHVGISVPVQAHSIRRVDQMTLLLNDAPVQTLTLTQITTDLWEGTGSWTPIMPGEYNLCVTVQRRPSCDTDTVRVMVLPPATPRAMLMATATPTPGGMPEPAGTPWPPAQVEFWADSLHLNKGDCTLLHWKVDYVTSVRLNGEPVAQESARRVCPEQTTTYLLQVEAPAGNAEQSLIVEVVEPSPTPSPTPTATIPPDVSGPVISNLSHSPDSVFDSPACGETRATINVQVNDPAGVAQVVLFYRVVKSGQTGTWRSLTLNHVGGNQYRTVLGPEELRASLTNYGGGRVEYYVKAQDQRGNLSQSPTRQFETKICLI